MNTIVASAESLVHTEESPRAANPVLAEIASAARHIGIFTVLVAGWAVLNTGLYLHRM